MSLRSYRTASAAHTERSEKRRNLTGGWLPAATLVQRANDAARKVCRDLDPADRADCAAAILAAALAAMPRPAPRRMPRRRKLVGRTAYLRALDAQRQADAAQRPRPYPGATLPIRATDRSVSYSALRDDALDWRRVHVKRREREAATEDRAMRKLVAERRSDGAALVRHRDAATLPDVTTAARAATVADQVSWRLSHAPHSAVDGARYANVWALWYSQARDLGTATAARDLDCDPAAQRKRESRGREAIRERHPSAESLFAAILDGAEAPTECTTRKRDRQRSPFRHEPRTTPREAAPVAAKRDPASDRNSRARAKRRRAAFTDAQRAEALRRRAAAEWSAMRSTLPTKQLRTKSGHAGETGIRA